MDGYRELNNGEHLQVGDVIVSDHPMSKSKRLVRRLTKKFAFVRFNDVAEGKYPIEYRTFGYESVPRQNFNQTRTTVYRKV